MGNCSGEICAPGYVCLEGCGGVNLSAPRCLGKKLLKCLCAAIKHDVAVGLVTSISQFKKLLFHRIFK